MRDFRILYNYKPPAGFGASIGYRAGEFTTAAIDVKDAITKLNDNVISRGISEEDYSVKAVQQL